MEETELDYSIGAGYVFQWLLATYIYMILKENSYILETKIKIPNKLKIFYKNIENFKNKCEEKFGNDFNVKFKIMLEGDGKCFEDINLLGTNNSKKNDSLIFIQVKTKGGKKPITKTSGIIKSIKNFVENINFQKDKYDNNFLFFIFTNKELSDNLIDELKGKNIKLFQSIINEIIKDNNNRKTTKNLNYPEETLVSIKKEEKDFINKMLVDMVNKDSVNLEDYLEYFSKDYLIKLYNLLCDLKLIIKNLIIIEKIGFKTLEKELFNFYEDKFYKKQYFNQKIAFNKTKIYKTNPLFSLYERYKYTYFKSLNGGKKVSSIKKDNDFINKGKFMM